MNTNYLSLLSTKISSLGFSRKRIAISAAIGGSSYLAIMKLSENSEEEAWGSQEWTKLAVTSAIAGIAGGLEQTCHNKLVTAIEKR